MSAPAPARLRRAAVVLALVFAALAAVGVAKREEIRRALVIALQPSYEPAGPTAPLAPRFDDVDRGRKRVEVDMQLVAQGISQPTDIQFPPGAPGYAVVLSKTGAAHFLRLENGLHGELFRVEVETASEQGLLGLAFHPQFASNSRFFINYVAKVGGRDVTRIAEWRLEPGDDFARRKAAQVRVLLEVEQPYPNHNAGCLAFGPDGYLYIGFGDGGFRDDPHGHGQNPSTLLGSMLRIDVNATARAKHRAYAIPADNPFVGKAGFAPETWAYGLRNPWRYSFDPNGRLVIADVGQNTWEEIDVARAGDNLGWAIEEGFSCFASDEAACAREDLVEPIFVYGRDEGVSVTGGYVYTGDRIPALRGMYVFGDFVSGRLFAIELPDDRTKRVQQPTALGRWPLMPSTFGRDPTGELYIADFRSGDILRVVPRAKK